jgi:microcompartment protein CcmL/EutN
MTMENPAVPTQMEEGMLRMVPAIGLIETRGLAASIEAADAMAKAATIRIIGQSKIGAGLVTIMIRGDIASVRSAVEAGATAAQKLGELLAAHVIPRPHAEVETILPEEPSNETATLD